MATTTNTQQTETYFPNGDLVAIVDDGATYAVVLSTLDEDYNESSLVLIDTPFRANAVQVYEQTISERDTAWRELHRGDYVQSDPCNHPKPAGNDMCETCEACYADFVRAALTTTTRQINY